MTRCSSDCKHSDYDDIELGLDVDKVESSCSLSLFLSPTSRESGVGFAVVSLIIYFGQK
jgi:hypothetical protein